jgi:hypothetical protein
VTVDQRELVERAGRGDHDAFAALVGASIARLEAVARLIVRDQKLARDVATASPRRPPRDDDGVLAMPSGRIFRSARPEITGAGPGPPQNRIYAAECHTHEGFLAGE